MTRPLCEFLGVLTHPRPQAQRWQDSCRAQCSDVHHGSLLACRVQQCVLALNGEHTVFAFHAILHEHTAPTAVYYYGTVVYGQVAKIRVDAVGRIAVQFDVEHAVLIAHDGEVAAPPSIPNTP